MSFDMMNTMKKIFACLMACLMLATFAACNPDEPKKENETTTKAPAEETTTTAPTDDPTDDPSDDPTDDPADDPTDDPADTTVVYTVTVVDEDNAPLANATVQLCVGELCRLPVLTDANGVATIEVDEADYTVKVTLAGYTGEAQYSFATGSTALTVQLTKNASEPDDSADAPTDDSNDGGSQPSVSGGGEFEMPPIPV